MRRLVTAAAMAALIVTGACGGSSGKAPTAATGGSVEIKVRALTFDPDSVVIKSGEKVVWTWVDNGAHNVTFPSFHSDTQDSGSYDHTFSSTGTFKYRCTLHPTMTGKVKVT